MSVKNTVFDQGLLDDGFIDLDITGVMFKKEYLLTDMNVLM